MPDIVLVFDVLGTLFSFTAIEAAICAALQREQPTLQAAAGKQVDVETVVREWFHASQRDFSYRTMQGAYLPIAKVLRANLPRSLAQAGITPSAGADAASVFGGIMSAVAKLEERPSLHAAASLIAAKKDVVRPVGASNGALSGSYGMLKRSLGEDLVIDPASSALTTDHPGKWGILSTDTAQLAKPSPGFYEFTKEQVLLGAPEGGKDTKLWFIASHMWDLYAAKNAGFKTAWVSYEELVLTPDTYGEPDIQAEDLEAAVKAILSAEGVA